MASVAGTAVAALVAVAVVPGWSPGGAPIVTSRSTPPAPITSTPTAAAPSTIAVHWVTTEVTLTYGGLARYYLVTRPAALSGQPLPVLMVLHGHSVTPQYEEQRTAFAHVTGAAIMVYPAGYQESWNAGNCCSPAMSAGVDDVGFLRTVLHQVLASQADADPGRVYLAGYSNGGKMALTLACDDPAAFAGVAVYGATAVSACPKRGPASLLEVASTGDGELTIGPGGTPKSAGAFVMPTVQGEAADYRAVDGCTAATTTAGEGSLTAMTWTSCLGGREVAVDLYAGGSHMWPAGGAGTPSAAEAMWTFFESVGA